MKVYFSGCDRAKFIDLVASEGGAVMVSPPQIALRNGVIELLKSKKISAILDSGGFQGQTDVYKYAEILNQVHEAFEWLPNLDVIGDQEKSNQNFLKLRSLLSEPIRSKLVWVYQNGSLDLLKEYAEEYKFVGIGGLVPLSKNSTELRRKLSNAGTVLNSVGAKAHVFGITGISILKWLTFQDWFESTDSTRWLSGIRHGEIFTENGRKFDSQDGFLFTQEERARHGIRVLNHIVSHKLPSIQLDLLETA